MDDFETLKECKQAFEILLDIKDNCVIINDDDNETFNKIEETMNVLSDIYSNAWELIASNNETYQQLETNLVDRFGHKCLISDLIDYAYLCKECDENMYVTEMEAEKKEYYVEDFNTLEEARNEYIKVVGSKRADIEEELNNKDERILECNELIEDIVECLNAEIQNNTKFCWWN